MTSSNHYSLQTQNTLANLQRQHDLIQQQLNRARRDEQAMGQVFSTTQAERNLMNSIAVAGGEVVNEKLAIFPDGTIFASRTLVRSRGYASPVEKLAEFFIDRS